MSSHLVTKNSKIQCPHAGVFTSFPSNQRVLINGDPVLTVKDKYSFIGCTFTPGFINVPCVSIDWKITSSRVKILNSSVILQNSFGSTKNASQADQGVPIIIKTQPRVRGT